MQHLENTFLRQLFAMKRGVRERSVAILETERVKRERYDEQCKQVAEALGKLDVAVSDCVRVLGTGT